MINYQDGLNTMVDLDAEAGRPNNGAPSRNTFRLVVRRTKSVNLAVLDAWLKGKTSFGEPVLEAMSKWHSKSTLTTHN